MLSPLATQPPQKNPNSLRGKNGAHDGYSYRVNPRPHVYCPISVLQLRRRSSARFVDPRELFAAVILECVGEPSLLALARQATSADRGYEGFGSVRGLPSASANQ